MRRLLSDASVVGIPLVAMLLAPVLVACESLNYPLPTEEEQATAVFPLDDHSLLPPDKSEGKWRTSVGSFQQPTDEQPLAFNHSIHAGAVADGGMGMDCQYCHSNARKTKHAGVPGVQVCWNCHKMVDPTGRPPLEKLKEYQASGEPIPWVKVHDLPDFVHFDHSRHVQGGVQCTECHADMSKETVAVRKQTMTMEMGWCLDCHAEHPSVDTNYGVQAELRRAELKDCYTCHK